MRLCFLDRGPRRLQEQGGHQKDDAISGPSFATAAECQRAPFGKYAAPMRGVAGA
jgi:hypothetical protein